MSDKESKHTPGPWQSHGESSDPGWHIVTSASCPRRGVIANVHVVAGNTRDLADARLIVAAPTQHKEMLRFLPIIERAESDPELWAKLTEGTGIATANAYRAAIAKAAGVA